MDDRTIAGKKVSGKASGGGEHLTPSAPTDNRSTPDRIGQAGSDEGSRGICRAPMRRLPGGSHLWFGQARSGYSRASGAGAAGVLI